MRTAAEIHAQLDHLQEERDRIQTQIAFHKADLAAGREPERDALWRANAEHAFRCMGREMTQWRVQLSAAIKLERQSAHVEREASFDRLFLRKARELLPRDLYEEVKRAAQAEEVSLSGSAIAEGCGT